MNPSPNIVRTRYNPVKFTEINYDKNDTSKRYQTKDNQNRRGIAPI